MRLYHGGVPGLQVGDRVLPPSETGRMSLAEFFAERSKWDPNFQTLMAAMGDDVPQRRDRVYLSTEEDEAMRWAALYVNHETAASGRGDCYEVEPDTPLEPDPDTMVPGRWWQAPAATVIRVVIRRCVMPKAQFDREMASELRYWGLREKKG